MFVFICLNLLTMIITSTDGIIISTNNSDMEVPSYEEFISNISSYRSRLYKAANPREEKNYNEELPPPRGSNISLHSNEYFKNIFVMDTEVGIWLVIRRIVSMDLVKQSLTLLVDQVFVWSDESITQEDNFNLPDEQFYEMVLDASKIWTPPIYPGNVIGSKVIVDLKQVQVPTTGQQIFYHRVMQYTIPCVLDVQKFPFDQHNCSIVLTQPTRLDFRIKMVSILEEMGVDAVETTFNVQGHQSVEWRLKTWHNYVRKRTSCAGQVHDPYDLDEFVLTIILQRHALFYASVLIFPCILLNVLSLLVFTLPVNSERDQYGVTLVLAYFVLLASIVDASPNTGDSVPLLGIYIAFSTAVMVTSFLLSLCLSLFNKKYAKLPLPKMLKSCKMLVAEQDYTVNDINCKSNNVSLESEACIPNGGDIVPGMHTHWLSKLLNVIGFLIIFGSHIIGVIIVACHIY